MGFHIRLAPNMVERSFVETLFLSLGEAKAKRKGGVFVGNKSKEEDKLRSPI